MHAEHIIKSKLYGEIDRSVCRDGLEQSDIDALRGLVVAVANEVGPAMELIPSTFRQYTVHDIRHVGNILHLMNLIIPPRTLQGLNAIELTMLVLGALLHDAGMIVGDKEKESALQSQEFVRFCGGYLDRLEAIAGARAAGRELQARAIEDALLAEYFRRLHPERVWDYVRSRNLNLRIRGLDLSDDVCRLCESHSWGFEESNDPRFPKKAVVFLDEPRIIKERRWEEEVRLDEFKEFYLEDRYGKEPPIGDTEPLEPIVLPSVIPFRKWSFSAHIHGRSWFWLLRGKGGRPCPHRGYLRMRRRLELSGVAAVCEAIEHRMRDLEASRIEFIKWFADATQSSVGQNRSKTWAGQIVDDSDYLQWAVRSDTRAKELREDILKVCIQSWSCQKRISFFFSRDSKYSKIWIPEPAIYGSK